MRLITMSKMSLTEDKPKKFVDDISLIYRAIRDYGISTGQTKVLIGTFLFLHQFKYEEVLRRIIAMGQTEENLLKCLDEYSKLKIWLVDENREWIRYIT